MGFLVDTQSTASGSTNTVLIFGIAGTLITVIGAIFVAKMKPRDDNSGGVNTTIAGQVFKHEGRLTRLEFLAELYHGKRNGDDDAQSSDEQTP